MSGVRIGFIPVVLGFLVGCSNYTLGEPVPEQMDPDSGVLGQEVAVTIQGRNFYADVHISYDQESNSYIRTDFSARLGELELLDVAYVDGNTLTARVPAGLAAGRHDLTVTGPSGLSGTLQDAFTVHEDTQDSDGDGVPDSEDRCPGFDDRQDADQDGVPDGCDPCHDGTLDPPWWNEDYAWRVPLLIEESNAGQLPTDYSVAAIVDTASLVSQDSLLSSGDDLRVVWHGGATLEELDRRLIAFDTATTEVWFKTRAAIDGSDGDYYLYYHNPAAAPPPDHWSDSMGAAATPSGVYLAADNFEDDVAGDMPDGWEGSNSYLVELDGDNQVLAVQGGNGPADYLFAGDFGWVDIVVQARFAIETTAAEWNGLFLRAEGDSDFDLLFYGLYKNNRVYAYHCSLTSPFAEELSPGGYGIDSWIISPAAGTGWHDYEARMQGQHLTFRYDGSELGSITLPGEDIPSGRIGCCSGYDATYLRFDDFVVRKYVDPEPTVSALVAEPHCR